MKNIATKVVLSIFFLLGSVLGICLYNPILNLIFKENILAIMLKALYLFPLWEVLIILFFMISVLGVFLNLLKKRSNLNINSTDKVIKVTLFLTLKMMAAGFAFTYILMATLWIIVMILIKVFVLK